MYFSVFCLTTTSKCMHVFVLLSLECRRKWRMFCISFLLFSEATSKQETHEEIHLLRQKVEFLFSFNISKYTKRKKCLKTLLLQKYVANWKDGKYLLVAHRLFWKFHLCLFQCISVLRLLWCTRTFVTCSRSLQCGVYVFVTSCFD